MAAVKSQHSGQFKKGHKPHNKGLSGYSNAGTFKKGHEGIKSTKSPEAIERMRELNLGVKRDYRGDKHWNWKGGVDRAEERLERQKFYKYVKPRVLARDNYTCQICKEEGGNLHADHIEKWADSPEKRFEVDNCRTLCMSCHYYVTFKRRMPKGTVWGNNLNSNRKEG